MKKLSTHNSPGFTLIEILVVISVFILLTAIILSILITILRTTKKSDSVILVRQNGEHAMTRLIRELRFAKSLDNPSTAGGAAPACSDTGINVQEIQITGTDLSQTNFTCPTNFNYPNFIALNGTALTNTNTIVVKSCSFNCSQLSNGPPNIKISFSLSKINSEGLMENNTTIPFQASVTLRNLNNQ